MALPGIDAMLTGLPTVKLTFITAASFTANQATYTGNFTLAENCDVLFLGLGESNGTYGVTTNITIAGVSRTLLPGENAGAFALGLTAGSIAYSITWGTTRARAAIYVFKVENVDSTVAVDSHNIFVTGLTSPFTLDVPDGGAAVVVVLKGGYSGDITWTNATEVSDLLVETSKFGCAYYENGGVGYEVDKVITPAYSGSSANAALGTAVSFR